MIEHLPTEHWVESSEQIGIILCSIRHAVHFLHAFSLTDFEYMFIIITINFVKGKILQILLQFIVKYNKSTA